MVNIYCLPSKKIWYHYALPGVAKPSFAINTPKRLWIVGGERQFPMEEGTETLAADMPTGEVRHEGSLLDEIDLTKKEETEIVVMDGVVSVTFPVYVDEETRLL